MPSQLVELPSRKRSINCACADKGAKKDCGESDKGNLLCPAVAPSTCSSISALVRGLGGLLLCCN